MNKDQSQFEIYRGDILLGVVTVAADECDFPWSVGYLAPSPAYSEVADLFQRETMLSDAASRAAPTDDEALALADEALEAILEPGIRFRSLRDDAWHDVVGITVDGIRVSWR